MLKILIERRPFPGLFLFLVSSILFGNNAHNPIISIIEIRGNIKTHDYIIEREIVHPLDHPLDSAIVIEDRNRLDNLGLFSETTWQVVPLENGTAKLSYVVVESIHRIPPLVFPNYQEDTGWSLTGFGLINNFRGKNQTLAIGGSIGGLDTYGFTFTDPWMFGDHVSYSLNMGRTLFDHRFLDRKLDVNSIYINLGKWYGTKIKTSIGIEVETKKLFNDIDEDEFFYIGATGNLKYDTRDIYWNPGEGILFSQDIYHREGIEPQDWRIMLWSQSYSWYMKINQRGKKRVLAFNTTLKRKLGNKDDLWLDYFGNSSTIRGWSLPEPDLYYSFKESFRFGHESVLMSMELRQELIPKHATPLGIEFGLVAVIFSDMGLIADDWSALVNQLPMHGAGVGIRIPFPMVGVIRVDYGYGYRDGVWNSGSIHWGIGQKF